MNLGRIELDHFAVPGASLDSSGYPTIRGGRENEQGFQFEGIPYTDAFTNQFVVTLATPAFGLLSVQLTPGAGSAAFGNNGTGSLNLISRKGSYPAVFDCTNRRSAAATSSTVSTRSMARLQRTTAGLSTSPFRVRTRDSCTAIMSCRLPKCMRS